MLRIDKDSDAEDLAMSFESRKMLSTDLIGKRIRLCRKLLGVTQSELVGREFTKSFVSQLKRAGPCPQSRLCSSWPNGFTSGRGSSSRRTQSWMLRLS